jgi:hypothetical protein
LTTSRLALRDALERLKRKPPYSDDARVAIEAAKSLLEIMDAIEDEGRVPRYHRQIMARHRKEWPTLWRAIDRIYKGQ